MGFSPAQVDEMTLFQFSAAVVGYSAAHPPEDKPKSAFSDDELKAMGIV